MTAKRKKPKQLIVDVRRRSQLRAWASYWDCSEQEVRDAARSTGGMVEDVGDWIKVNVAR